MIALAHDYAQLLGAAAAAAAAAWQLSAEADAAVDCVDSFRDVQTVQIQLPWALVFIVGSFYGSCCSCMCLQLSSRPVM